MALKLKRLGISRVYPIVGGMEEWIASGLPTD
ncbi:MAG: rhodanese-like domain-containing protein [Pseudomonadales bacterium]|nr:rhodanese-like domain-containing protein [Pseudomonadales bacterium]